MTTLFLGLNVLNYCNYCACVYMSTHYHPTNSSQHGGASVCERTAWHVIQLNLPIKVVLLLSLFTLDTQCTNIVEMKHVILAIITGLLSWCPIFDSSCHNVFEGGTPTCVCLVFIYVAETSSYVRAPGALCCMGYLSETYLKLKSRQISFIQNT